MYARGEIGERRWKGEWVKGRKEGIEKTESKGDVREEREIMEKERR